MPRRVSKEHPRVADDRDHVPKDITADAAGAADDSADEGSAPDDGARYFKVVSSSTGFAGGRYKGDQPSVAARKAARSVLRDSSELTAAFVIKETTHSTPSFKRGSFQYRVTKEQLSEPYAYEIGRGGVGGSKGKTISVNFNYKVKSLGKLPKTEEQKRKAKAAKRAAAVAAISAGANDDAGRRRVGRPRSASPATSAKQRVGGGRSKPRRRQMRRREEPEAATGAPSSVGEVAGL